MVRDNRLWRDEQQFFRANDEQRAKWLEVCKELDTKAKDIYQQRREKRDQVCKLIHEIWDNDPRDGRRIASYVSKQQILSGGGNVSSYERLVYRAKEDKEKREKEEKARQHKKKMEEQRRNDLRTIVEIAVRHNLDHQAEAETLLNALCKINPYLNLAMAMYLTRCDWSEGFYRVEYALTEFETAIPHAQRSENDHAIIQAQRERLYPDDDYRDSDGRIFRDGEWSYNDIFELVDSQLKDDAMKLYEIMEY